MIKLVFVFFPLLLGLQVSLGQNPISEISVSTHYVGLDSVALAQMDTNQLAATPKTFAVVVELASSSNVSRLVLMLGSADRSNDIFHKEFEYGVSGDFGDGTSYHSSGNEIILGTNVYGEHRHYLQVYAIMEDESESEHVNLTVN